MERIVLASDQGGYEHKEHVRKYLETLDIEFEDLGVFSEESMDYPDVIYPAAKAVANHEFDRGIILCGTGIGASIVANKVKGIRCALVTSPEVAQLTRDHNNSNVLALAGRTTPLDVNLEIVRIWLETPYSNETRHNRRIEKISDIEVKEGR